MTHARVVRVIYMRQHGKERRNAMIEGMAMSAQGGIVEILTKDLSGCHGCKNE